MADVLKSKMHEWLLYRGDELPKNLQKEVLLRAINRHTGQFKPDWLIFTGHSGNPEAFPTHATDAEWLADQIFRVNKDGQLSRYGRSNHLLDHDRISIPIKKPHTVRPGICLPKPLQEEILYRATVRHTGEHTPRWVSLTAHQAKPKFDTDHDWLASTMFKVTKEGKLARSGPGNRLLDWTLPPLKHYP